MSEYTTTKEGFQNAMKISLTGPPEDSRSYYDATATSSFYHMFNGTRLEGKAYIDSIAEWRGKISDYDPVVFVSKWLHREGILLIYQSHEFLRDGDKLAARMTGTIKVDGTDTFFESFMFAEVEEKSGKMEWLIERSVWGAVGQEPGHGVH